MTRIYVTLIYALFGYLVMTPFTSLISLDLTNTAWTNLLTYIYVVFWPVFIGGVFFMTIFISIAVAFAVAAIMDWLGV